MKDWIARNIVAYIFILITIILAFCLGYKALIDDIQIHESLDIISDQQDVIANQQKVIEDLAGIRIPEGSQVVPTAD